MSLSSRANVFNALALVAVCVTSALHWFGVESSLYWIYFGWWDVPIHFFAGLTIGSWAAAVAIRMRLSFREAVYLIIILTVVVGVAWEVWEIWSNVGVGNDPWFDCVKDLLNDFLGALLAVFLFKTLSGK